MPQVTKFTSAYKQAFYYSLFYPALGHKFYPSQNVVKCSRKPCKLSDRLIGL